MRYLKLDQQMKVADWLKIHPRDKTYSNLAEVRSAMADDLGFAVTESNFRSIVRALKMDFRWLYDSGKCRPKTPDLLRRIELLESRVAEIQSLLTSRKP